LQQEGDEIIVDECDGVDSGSETRDAGSEDDDDTGEIEVDGGREEGGANG